MDWSTWLIWCTPAVGVCLFSLEIEHKGRRHAFKGWILRYMCYGVSFCDSRTMQRQFFSCSFSTQVMTQLRWQSFEKPKQMCKGDISENHLASATVQVQWELLCNEPFGLATPTNWRPVSWELRWSEFQDFRCNCYMHFIVLCRFYIGLFAMLGKIFQDNLVALLT